MDSFDFGRWGPFFPTLLVPSLYSEAWACDSFKVLQQRNAPATFMFEATSKDSLAGMKFGNSLEITQNMNPADISRFEKMSSWHSHQVVEVDGGMHLARIMATKESELVIDDVGSNPSLPFVKGDFLLSVGDTDVRRAGERGRELARSVLSEKSSFPILMRAMRAEQPDAANCSVYWDTRQQLKFAPDLQHTAADFIQPHGGDFLAVHWRHGDAALLKPDNLLYTGGYKQILCAFPFIDADCLFVSQRILPRPLLRPCLSFRRPPDKNSNGCSCSRIISCPETSRIFPRPSRPSCI